MCLSTCDKAPTLSLYCTAIFNKLKRLSGRNQAQNTVFLIDLKLKPRQVIHAEQTINIVVRQMEHANLRRINLMTRNCQRFHTDQRACSKPPAVENRALRYPSP